MIIFGGWTGKESLANTTVLRFGESMTSSIFGGNSLLKMGRAITPQKGHQRRCHITPLCFHGNMPIYGWQTSIYGHVATETEGCYITPPLVTLLGCKYTPHF